MLGFEGLNRMTKDIHLFGIAANLALEKALKRKIQKLERKLRKG